MLGHNEQRNETGWRERAKSPSEKRSVDLPRVESKVWPHHIMTSLALLLRKYSKETLSACRGLVYHCHGRRPMQTEDRDLSVDTALALLHVGQLETLRFWPTAGDRDCSIALHFTRTRQKAREQ